jgi:hypothetical protein
MNDVPRLLAAVRRLNRAAVHAQEAKVVDRAGRADTRGAEDMRRRVADAVEGAGHVALAAAIRALPIDGDAGGEV